MLRYAPKKILSQSGLTHEINDKHNTTLMFDYPEQIGRIGGNIKIRGKVKYVPVTSLSNQYGYWNSQRSYTGADRNYITLVDIEILSKEEKEEQKPDARPTTPINYIAQPPSPVPASVVPKPVVPPSLTQPPMSVKKIPYQHGNRIEEDFTIKDNKGKYGWGSTLYILIDNYGRTVSSFSKIDLGQVGSVVRLSGLIQIKGPYTNLVNPSIIPQKAIPAQAPNPIPASLPLNLPPTTSTNWYAMFLKS
jgi:hypothetical protein